MDGQATNTGQIDPTGSKKKCGGGEKHLRLNHTINKRNMMPKW